MKARRFVVASDSHGDMVDQTSATALWEFIQEWKPEIRVHAGDAFDFRNLRKGASDDEKAASLVDDWEAGSDFLRRLFDGGKSNHFLRGNHDERLWNFADSANGVLRDYAKDGVKRIEQLVKKLRANMLPYDSAHGVLRLGDLKVVHGYHTGVNAARSHAQVYGNVLYGHTHSIESSAIPSLDPAEARGIGCLCQRDMGYVNSRTAKLRWGQGWAYGLLFENGKYQLFQTRKIDGNFYYATEINQ